MGSLLGNLIFAGLTTLLTTQSNLGAVNAAANLYSVNAGMAATAPPDVALFQPSALAQVVSGLGAGVGYGCATLQPLLVTRAPSGVAVWFNANTTAQPGDMMIAYMHSIVR